MMFKKILKLALLVLIGNKIVKDYTKSIPDAILIARNAQGIHID